MNIRHQKRWWVLLVFLGATAAALYWRLNQTSATKGRAPNIEQAVTVVQAQVADTPVVVDVSGMVVSLQAVEVRSQTSNVIKEVRIKEGQLVQPGQIMFLLDDRNELAQVARLRATLARNRALGLDLDRQYARAQELRAQSFISQAALDSSQAQREAQWALVKSDEAAVTSAQVALGLHTIRAPIGGRTGQIQVFPGSLVQPTAAPLLTITQTDPIGVQFSLPESQYQRLKTSQTGNQRVKVSITLPATGQNLTGELIFVDSGFDPGNASLRLKARFANPNGDLWPGQFVQIRVELGQLKDATLIPPETVVTTANGRFVYVVTEDFSVQPKPIQELYSNHGVLAVSGITATDRIVLDGKQNLRPGGKVRIIAPTGAKP